MTAKEGHGVPTPVASKRVRVRYVFTPASQPPQRPAYPPQMSRGLRVTAQVPNNLLTLRPCPYKPCPQPPPQWGMTLRLLLRDLLRFVFPRSIYLQAFFLASAKVEDEF